MRITHGRTETLVSMIFVCEKTSCGRHYISSIYKANECMTYFSDIITGFYTLPSVVLGR